MKVMILANNDIGLYKFRKELLEELVTDNEVYLCLPNGEFIKALMSLGCKYIPCEFNRRGMNPIGEAKLFMDYWRIIKSIKPDVVLTYTIKPNVYGGIVCSLLGIPYISNVTGLGTSIENGGLTQKVMLALYRYGLKGARKVFFQNEENCRFMRNHGIGKNSYEILPGSGVNLEENCFEEYPSEEGGIKFLFVGRIMKDKGIEEFLECAKQIHDEHPTFSFDIVGDYDEEVYRRQIEDYQEKGIIRAFGLQNDVHSFMKSHHALVQPSYHEGLSNVLLEAAACGRPVLASNIPGCRETFDEGISGFGFEPQSVDSLVKSVKKLISITLEDRKQMGRSGREKVEKEFSRQLVIDSYLREINYLAK